MKTNATLSLPDAQLTQAKELGVRIARLRAAKAMRQNDAALRAGISRSTASRLESGDPGVALGQLLRYLNALAPGLTLAQLLAREQPAELALQWRERTKRVRLATGRGDRADLNF
jgi:transcriptional regulator with XRE-family HTH domain